MPVPSAPTGPTVFKDRGSHVFYHRTPPYPTPPKWLDLGVATPWTSQVEWAGPMGFSLSGTLLEKGDNQTVGAHTAGLQEEETCEVE